MRNPADIYEKIVFWSEEDECFIGMCPELFAGGIHGDNEFEVFKELLETVDEWVEIYRQDNKSLPVPQKYILEAA